jgi:hypothetical protein
LSGFLKGLHQKIKAKMFFRFHFAWLQNPVKKLILKLSKFKFQNGRLTIADKRFADHCANVPPAWQQTVVCSH